MEVFEFEYSKYWQKDINIKFSLLNYLVRKIIFKLQQNRFSIESFESELLLHTDTLMIICYYLILKLEKRSFKTQKCIKITLKLIKNYNLLL